MIKKKIIQKRHSVKQVPQIEGIAPQKNWKKLSKTHVSQITELSFGFGQEGVNLTFEQSQGYAGNVSFAGSNGNALQFSHPYYLSQVLPGQTVRIDTGWKLKDIPDGYTLHCYPHTDLLEKGFISNPKVMTGAPNDPIQVEMYNASEQPQWLDTAVNVITAVVSIASKIIPLFL